LPSNPEITALVATGRGATEEVVVEAATGRAAGREALTKDARVRLRTNPFMVVR